MAHASGTPAFLSEHKKSVITFLLFIAYAGAVFWSNFLSLQRVQQDALVHDAHGEGADLALVGAQCPAGFEIVDPVVQRARHGCAVHDALGQRPAPVGAAVLDSEYLVLHGAEHRDRAR